jgi:hypothetical protein
MVVAMTDLLLISRVRVELARVIDTELRISSGSTYVMSIKADMTLTRNRVVRRHLTVTVTGHVTVGVVTGHVTVGVVTGHATVGVVTVRGGPVARPTAAARGLRLRGGVTGVIHEMIAARRKTNILVTDIVIEEMTGVIGQVAVHGQVRHCLNQTVIMAGMADIKARDELLT